jgi:hypothetical protein
MEKINTELLSALRALTDWGREHTSPRDPNTPHDLLVRAVAVIDEADKAIQQPAPQRPAAGHGYFGGVSLTFVVDTNHEFITTPDGSLRLLPCETCHRNYWLPCNVVSHICDECAAMAEACDECGGAPRRHAEHCSLHPDNIVG